MLAAMSIVLTAQYQMWQRNKQIEHGLSGMQITYSVAVPQVVLGVVTSGLFDVRFPVVKELLLLPKGGLLEHTWHKDAVFWIVACCLIAIVMNTSTYALLGRVSPVTYQVLGQFKTCLIVGFGYAFFDAKAPPTWLLVRFGGCGIAVVGILSYALQKHNEDQKKKERKE